jgi:hypothetical protein
LSRCSGMVHELAAGAVSHSTHPKRFNKEKRLIMVGTEGRGE